MKRFTFLLLLFPLLLPACGLAPTPAPTATIAPSNTPSPTATASPTPTKTQTPLPTFTPSPTIVVTLTYGESLDFAFESCVSYGTSEIAEERRALAKLHKEMILEFGKSKGFDLSISATIDDDNTGKACIFGVVEVSEGIWLRVWIAEDGIRTVEYNSPR